MVCSSGNPRFSVEDWAECRAPHLGGMPPMATDKAPLLQDAVFRRRCVMPPQLQGFETFVASPGNAPCVIRTHDRLLRRQHCRRAETLLQLLFVFLEIRLG